MIKPVYIIIIGLLFSCKTKSIKEVETISMDELMGTVEDISIDSTKIDLNIPINNSIISHLIYDLSLNFDTSALVKQHPFDSYGFNTSQKVNFIPKNIIESSKIEFYIYNFSDSLKLNNAFYNWLDCFGDNCTEIKVREDTMNLNTQEATTFIYDTTLIHLKFTKQLDKITKQNLLKKISEKYGQKYRYQISVSKKGNLSWN